jgi:ABC-2 type transport system ATP-binding protein
VVGVAFAAHLAIGQDVDAGPFEVVDGDKGSVILGLYQELFANEQIASRLILRKGRVVAHDSVARLREVMSESSLEGVFAQLTNADDTDIIARRILDVVAA